jgi:hypothetical protein
MNYIKGTSVVFGVLFTLGMTQAGQATVLQAVNTPAQQGQIILTHGGGGHGGGGHGGFHGGGGHMAHGGHGWHGGGHGWHGGRGWDNGWGWGGFGAGVGLGVLGTTILDDSGPSYQSCGYDEFGNYVCADQMMY